MENFESFLPAFLRSVSGNEEITLVFLQELWPRIAGDELAQKTRPSAFHKKNLILEVPNVIWKKQLEILRKMFIRSINDFWKAPLVEKIDFKVRLEDKVVLLARK